ncbi:hypothetical protein K502DRAFT_347881 [Neoconidiobolus thromboides FSU 785]|nr:hypothetical protein K502DRAFT_347881 [Neoconidiobolus thromboides FSU 785]
MIDSIYIISVILAIIALIISTFLILFAYRIEHKGQDIQLILAIAFVEYIPLFILIVIFIFNKITGKEFIATNEGCTFSGFFVDLVLFFEIILNSILSLERYSKFSKSKWIKCIIILFLFNSFCFVTLLITCAIKHQFSTIPSGFVCLLNKRQHILAAFTFYFSQFNWLLGIVVILYCYSKISKEVIGSWKIISGTNYDPTTFVKKKSKNYYKAFIKVHSVLIIYTICMFGTTLTSFLESVFSYFTESFIEKSGIMHSISVIFFAIGMVANSSIILFLHTGISNEAEKVIEKVKSLFCNNL